VDALEAEARTLALAALRHLNSLAHEKQAAARQLEGPKQRFRFGTFFWREETSNRPAPEDTP
jgi:hypothetical protein